jgi:hypothetical protein
LRQIARFRTLQSPGRTKKLPTLPLILSVPHAILEGVSYLFASSMNTPDDLILPKLPADFGSKGVSISIDCMDEILKVSLQPEQWATVRSGDWFERSGPRWHCDEASFRTRWIFSSGSLTVEYGKDGGIAFEGELDSTTIVEKGKRGLSNQTVDL